MQVISKFTFLFILTGLIVSYSNMVNAGIAPSKFSFNNRINPILRNKLFADINFRHGKGPMIKVKIGKSAKKVEVSGVDLKRKLFVAKNRRQKVRRFSGRKKIGFNCSSKRLVSSKLLASVKSMTGLLTFNQQKYHGDLLFATSEEHRGCDVINQVPLEHYISSLLSKEMNPKWHIEALKAQAVAARSYALHKMVKRNEIFKLKNKKNHYDLESSEKHQVGGDFFDATAKTIDATMDTFGEVLLTNSGSFTPIFFHADSGGKLFRPDQIWGQRVEGYVSKPSPSCHTPGKNEWKSNISNAKFIKFLSWAKRKGYLKGKGELVGRLRVAKDSLSKNRLRVYLGERVYSIAKGLFRRYFGRKLFSSNYFVAKKTKNGISVSGRGLGHGVGMSQLGALHLAQKGWDYKKILAFFYPKHELKKIY